MLRANRVIRRSRQIAIPVAVGPAACVTFSTGGVLPCPWWCRLCCLLDSSTGRYEASERDEVLLCRGTDVGGMPPEAPNEPAAFRSSVAFPSPVHRWRRSAVEQEA